MALDAKDQPGDAAKAEALYRQLIAKAPDHAKAARAHLRIALLLERAKKYDDVIGYVSGVVPQLKDPAHRAEAWLLVGRAHNSAGRAKEAVAALDRISQTSQSANVARGSGDRRPGRAPRLGDDQARDAKADEGSQVGSAGWAPCTDPRVTVQTGSHERRWR